ncbi:hypothetical protein A8C75_13575 [Marinobacterium aestuarii]|uniref:Uncharacterized protein n=1 Tax=Marinobacterium aestuarii TaxID=1821621 RepID=A0A1A9EZM2_9GAMM|nr:hypothetical protein A8C75_13575 [Marinobacterium aestuarii]
MKEYGKLAKLLCAIGQPFLIHIVRSTNIIMRSIMSGHSTATRRYNLADDTLRIRIHVLLYRNTQVYPVLAGSYFA